MKEKGKTTFAIKSWDEKPYEEFEGGRKLTRARVVFTYQGDMEGEGTVEYLMAYGDKGLGNYVAIEHVVGRVGGRQGSFVAQHTGTFEAHGVTDAWFVTTDSATGELQGLSGGGEFTISGQGPHTVNFHYEHSTLLGQT
jgi:hypothetical protein